MQGGRLFHAVFHASVGKSGHEDGVEGLLISPCIVFSEFATCAARVALWDGHRDETQRGPGPRAIRGFPLPC